MPTFEDRESIRIAYVPLAPALKDRRKLRNVCESVRVLSPDARWGSIKIGAGTPPVRIALNRDAAWMSVLRRRRDRRRPPQVPFLPFAPVSTRSTIWSVPIACSIDHAEPVRAGVGAKLYGVVDNVVFPTGIDPRADLGERVYDVYYGMADSSIGAARMTIDPWGFPNAMLR